MGFEVILGAIACLCCTLGGAAALQMQQNPHRHGGMNPQHVAIDEAILEQLKRQEREGQLDAHIKRRAREEAEAVINGKKPTEADATPPAGKSPPAPQVPTPVAMPRPMYYGPMMPQMGYNYGYQTPLQQQIQRNNPFNGIMI